MIRFRRLFLLPIDVTLIAAAYLFAHLIRFEWSISPGQGKALVMGMVLAVVVTTPFFVLGGFYRRLWRYASVPDLTHILKTVTVACLTSTLFTLFVLPSQSFSRSVPVLDWILLNGLIMGRSLLWRVLQERDYLRRHGTGSPILIVGAGMAGQMLFREIKRNPRFTYWVVGFLDDDPAKIGSRINDVPVLGRIKDLPRHARRHAVQKVIIAIPSAPALLLRKIVHSCHEAGMEVQTLPAITDMLDSKMLVAQIRAVNLEDLLGRSPVRLDTGAIEAYLEGHRVLITGAGGSIGSELCRQVARFSPREIILFEVAETPLHSIQIELARNFPHLQVTPFLADVRDREQVGRVFKQCRPNVVFHAAACKHVPMMEYHPPEAVKTNVFGTRNLARAASEAGVERFVMISTDKAVNPTNVMGASKRAAELFVQAFNDHSDTEFITVRFGNVLGSNGSVVPLFQEQIRRGGPITVTHRDVTRYFMTIPEASQLVLQAGSMGQGGEIFLLDMGDPVRIVDLAEDLIRLSGLEPGDDIAVEFTGLRPGEKLFEELLIDGEDVKPTAHRKILVAAARTVDLAEVERLFEELTFCQRKGDHDLVVEKLREIVPEYRPNREGDTGKLAVHPAALTHAGVRGEV